MSSEMESPKREQTPTTTSALSMIPQKRAIDEVHSPAVPSPLNPDVRASEPQLQADDAAQAARAKTSRVKKDSQKKRDAKGGDSVPQTPDPKLERGLQQTENSPLRYKLAPPKPSDFEVPRGPVMSWHHEIQDANGRATEFFETSDQ
jgi:COMPASS component BRE2